MRESDGIGARVRIDSAEIGKVIQIWRYPVSSLAGECLTSARLTFGGVEGDRAYGVFDRSNGTNIYPVRDARWNAAPLAAARLVDRRLEISAGQGWAVGDDVAGLLAEVFGQQIQLRAYGAADRPRYNRAPLHLLSVQALDSLRRHLPGSAVDARRFRPNLLVDLPHLGGDIPEYALLGQEFTLGGLRLRGTVPCGRCGFTTLPAGELPQDPDILRALVRQYERNFGIYCDVLDEGGIEPGATLRVKAQPTRVVIVGGGQAGATAARALRRLGHAGPIWILAEERHLPYERPPLSKSAAPGAPILSSDEAARTRIEMDLGNAAAALDLRARQVETAEGEILPYDRLILATGGRARRLPGLDRGHGRVHSLRLREDAERLWRVLRPGARLFIQGGGWIGMELAAAARMAGAEVDLFLRGDRLAPRVLPGIVAEALARMHCAHGVRLHVKAEPRFQEHADHIACRNGGQDLVADHLLVAIGMRANDGIARRAGLDCDDGIVTDDGGATRDPAVFAIGDVARPPAGRIESWQNAEAQAEAVARQILGLAPAPPAPPRFWSEQFGRRLQIVGRPSPAAPLVAEAEDFWDFGDFAIGIDQPEQIHRVARRVSDAPAASARPAPAAQVQRSRHRLCASADLVEGALLRIAHPAHGPLCATRQNGRVHVTDDRCPHAVASLSEGFVDGGRLICPLHFAEFDLTDGSPHHAPEGCGGLMIHPATERDGQILVDLPD
ncbi:NADPH-dependent 2,4-dienoyl-CoA reductase, sulfur reductase [Paracoccus tibetensis]|uniref:NADPH-dependent 2,4-dienoyl-CoA reductase, sulfur reductase n=1 Tax=Paracoccus tibetensis TaxID=336292 RepID=A0A1G5K178_9RHOB|nr:NADPH-dependent 2,4-dienoyl-CoA reductase, sulfur reductase [Paracoccus tibetensis]